MYDYLLPIGSVVRIKGAEKLMMLFGVLQKSPSMDERVFDYIAVPYPEGRYDPRLDICFDHKDVEEVIFRGYEDDGDERKAFIATHD